MQKYLCWEEKKITNEEEIEISYLNGFLFTRKDKGIMNQTRSIRINLDNFSLSSENKRVLKKVEKLILEKKSLPLEKYHWTIGKMAKDFYETKFGSGVMSAVKIKEMLSDPLKSNFNLLLTYLDTDDKEIGYTICFESDSFLHYCYPFYKLDAKFKNIGMGMMIKAIQKAKEENKKYIYIGSFQRPTDTYKLQFKGIEWFDGREWQVDIKRLKETLN